MARKGSRKRWNKRGGDGAAVAEAQNAVKAGFLENLKSKAENMKSTLSGSVDSAEEGLNKFQNTGKEFVGEKTQLFQGFIKNAREKASNAIAGNEAARGGRRRRSTKRKTAKRSSSKRSRTKRSRSKRSRTKRSRTKRSRTTKRKRVRFSMRSRSKRRH